jgi:cobalt-zinc-cadmium efflux system outer membrane protein
MRPLILALLLLPATLLAEGNSALSLRQAEAMWQQHSRELRLAGLAVSGAAADSQVARQIPNPEVSLNAQTISPSTGFGAGGWKDKRMDSVFRIEQVIERGGKRELRIKGAESRLEASRFEADEMARQQLGTLRRAYYDLLLAQEKLALARDTATLYGKSADAGKLRQKAGDIAPVDLTRLQIDRVRADSEARQAQSDVEQAQLALAYLIGEPDARRLQAGDPWPAVDGKNLPEIEIPQRPDLDAAQRRVDAAEADRDLARALKKRDLTVGLQYEHNRQSEPVNSYGLGVSLPLFVWHEYEGQIARAETDYAAARLAFEQQQAQVRGQVAQSRSALLAARDRYQRLEGGLLADAERVAKAAEFAYTKGAMGLMDLLDARRTLRQIQGEAAVARADYAKAAADWQLQTEFRKLP